MAASTSSPQTRQASAALRPWLRAEGAAVLLASVVAYAVVGASWWWFVLLLLVPDATMAGYLANPRVGALVYNAGHAYVGPLLLGAAAVGIDAPFVLALALIWTAHIGMDRMLGYGLKEPAGFQHTHLGSIGRAA